MQRDVEQGTTSLSALELESLPALARANHQAALFERSAWPDDEIATQVCHFVSLVNTLEPQILLHAINADRSRLGFPPHTDISQIEDRLSQRKKYYLQTLRVALSRLDVSSLVKTITQLADSMTVGGTSRASELVYDLTDTYAVVFHASLEEEAGHVRQTLRVIREYLALLGDADHENVIGAMIQMLADLMRHWRNLARPIQLSAKSRGLTHIPSMDLCAEVRRLAVDSYRHFGLPHVARQLTPVMEEVFADVPEALATLGLVGGAIRR